MSKKSNKHDVNSEKPRFKASSASTHAQNVQRQKRKDLLKKIVIVIISCIVVISLTIPSVAGTFIASVFS